MFMYTCNKYFAKICWKNRKLSFAGDTIIVHLFTSVCRLKILQTAQSQLSTTSFQEKLSVDLDLFESSFLSIQFQGVISFRRVNLKKLFNNK